MFQSLVYNYFFRIEGEEFMKNPKTVIQSVTVNKAIDYAIKNPEKNFPKLVNMAKIFASNTQQKKMLEGIIQNPENNMYYQFFQRMLTENHPNCVKGFVQNLGINAILTGYRKAQKIMRKKHFAIPASILIDPTSACNLNCIGCWAAEYNKKDNLSIELLDRIITEGKELGIFWYLYSGGEPLMRKKDLITLARKHNDCYFLAFTNATLVDEEFAQELAHLGNFTLAISVEGYENSTDFRRGKGTYQKVMKSMDLLKKYKVFFGFSTCYHRKNIDVIGSEGYYDFMIEKGAMFGWLFTYIPLGKDAQLDLITTPEQRRTMFEVVRNLRKEKRLFLIDFWNDGDFSRGCIAGGRTYFHINANGDVEPCAFIHYSNVNIKNTRLQDALQNPLFEEYRYNQPFNSNYLQPCPLLDNPDWLKDMVHRSGAKSTQPIDEESVDDLTNKLQDISKAWAPVAREIYETSNALADARKNLPPRYWDEEWYTAKEELVDNKDGDNESSNRYPITMRIKDVIYALRRGC